MDAFKFSVNEMTLVRRLRKFLKETTRSASVSGFIPGGLVPVSHAAIRKERKRLFGVKDGTVARG